MSHRAVHSDPAYPVDESCLISMRDAKKWGFGVPWKNYFREVPALREIVSTLPELEPIWSGPFDRAKLRTAISQFCSGDDRQAAMMTRLLMIAIWYQAHSARSARQTEQAGWVRR